MIDATEPTCSGDRARPDPLQPRIRFEGLPSSQRLAGLIEARCRALGSDFPAIKRCEVALRAGEARSDPSCTYILRIEVETEGRRVYVEQPCRAPEAHRLGPLLEQAFNALRRRLGNRPDH